VAREGWKIYGWICGTLMSTTSMQFKASRVHEWIAGYPSAALFQKPMDEIEPLKDPLFREAEDP
jgi:hypothetical protein